MRNAGLALSAAINSIYAKIFFGCFGIETFRAIRVVHTGFIAQAQGGVAGPLNDAEEGFAVVGAGTEVVEVEPGRILGTVERIGEGDAVVAAAETGEPEALVVGQKEQVFAFAVGPAAFEGAAFWFLGTGSGQQHGGDAGGDQISIHPVYNVFNLKGSEVKTDSGYKGRLFGWEMVAACVISENAARPDRIS